MAKTIYVGNLEWGTTVEDLIKFFEPIGKVLSANIIKDYHTNRSKGYGFIEMENADKAIEDLNNKELHGRTITVNKVRHKKVKL